jgi:hypothetical protein
MRRHMSTSGWLELLLPARLAAVDAVVWGCWPLRQGREPLSGGTGLVNHRKSLLTSFAHSILLNL